MKPETESLKTLQYTQSAAKTIEFEVPQEIREKLEASFSHKPEDIFDIVIAMLGEISESYKNSEFSENEIYKEEEKLRFCAEFLDNYKNTNRLSLLNDYCLLIGAAAYYLSNLPGSSKVLINEINNESLNLDGDGLENLLYTILADQKLNYSKFSDSRYTYFLEKITYDINAFNKFGINNNIIKTATELEDYALNIGSNREILLSDIIFSIIFKKLSISSWSLLPKYSELSLEIWKDYLSSKNSIKTLWPSQILLGKANVFKGESCVIQLPTSSGKTKSTELIIRSAFLAKRTKIAVIIAPFKALCHEIKRDYRKAFRSENVKIDELNDILIQEDLNAFITNDDKKSIIILTPEKFFYLIHFDSTFIKNIGLIILDEGHQFDNGSRGITYELLITYLNKELLELFCSVHRILTGHRVYHEECLGGVYSLFDGANLLHHRLVDGQTAGGIDDYKVVVVLFRLFDGVQCNLHGVFRLGLAVYGNANLLAKHLQLVDSCGTVYVAGYEQGISVFLLLEEKGEL